MSEVSAFEFVTMNAFAPAFMADHMVIKLGKYLRIAGYDVTWDKTVRTHELIRRANSEDRVFLTRNRRLLHQYPVPLRLMCVSSSDPVAQFHEVAERLNVKIGAGLFTRCIRCNVELTAVSDNETVAGKVHANVMARYKRFFSCPHCGTVFWLGGHVRNTCRKLNVVSVDEMP